MFLRSVGLGRIDRLLRVKKAAFAERFPPHYVRAEISASINLPDRKTAARRILQTGIF